MKERQEKVDNYLRDPRKNPNPGTIPQKIVIDIGTHDADADMAQNSLEISVKNLKKDLDNQFESSQIYVCPIANQTAFNDFLAEQCKKWENWTFLDTVLDVFETDPSEPLHWTPEGAQKVADKIFERLN